MININKPIFKAKVGLFLFSLDYNIKIRFKQGIIKFTFNRINSHNMSIVK